MNIKDLEMTKDLSREERAVRGGFGNVALIGGQAAGNGVSGWSFASPQTNLQIGPTVTQTYAPVSVDLDTITLTKTLNAIGSMAAQS